MLNQKNKCIHICR